MQKKLKQINKVIVDGFKNPKVVLNNFKNGLINYTKENKLYLVFVLFAWLNAFFLQITTVGFDGKTPQSLLISLLVIMILGSFHHLFKNGSKQKYLITVFIFFSIITTVNSLYYNWYQSFATISILSTGKFLGDLGMGFDEQIFKLKDLIFPVILIAYFVVIKHTKIKEPHFSFNYFKKSIGVLLIVLFFVISNLTSVEKSRFISQWNREFVVSHFGIYAYQLSDIVKSVEPTLSGLFGYDNAIKNFNDYYAEKEDTSKIKNKYTNIYEGKNLITIHAESIQTFLIGLSINGQEITPNLNKLVKDSIYFDNFYPQVSVGTSSDTEFTINNSLMPTTVGTVFSSYFKRTFNSTPNLLKEKGYSTFIMHGNKASFWNRDQMYPHLGYDTFYSENDYEIDEEIGLGLSDKSFFRQSLQKLIDIHETEDNYYATLITLSNHTPFKDEDEMFDPLDLNYYYLNEFNEEEIQPYLTDTRLGKYLISSHYADQALGQFIDALNETNIMDDSVLVVYGDHDARLPRKDYNLLYNYNPETEKTYTTTDEQYIPFGEYEYEINRKVPLIIYSKETKAKHKETISTAMGMIDVMPTLGNMFNFYNKYQLGSDIFNLQDNTVIFPNGNFLTNKVYYNSQKGEYYTINNNVITEEYLQESQIKSEKILRVSSDLIIYDLIKIDREDSSKVNELEEERITPLYENQKNN